MPFSRRAWVVLFAVSILGVGCSPIGTASTPRPTSSSADSPIGGVSPEPSPAPIIHGDTLSVDVSIGYNGIREWMRNWGGIALVEVADVGPIRWDTPSGARPDESLLHSAPEGHADAPGIGRVIQVRRVKLLSGAWLGNSGLARYWRVGGSVGADEMISDLQLPTFDSGSQAIAFLLPQPVDIGSGGAAIPVEVGWLFPIDATGRVNTLDPNEKITMQDLESLVP